MRGRTLAIAVAALAVVVVVVLAAGVYVATRRAAEVAGVPLAGNALQPLADDLTWIYRPRPNLTLGPTGPYVVAVVGRETLAGEAAWLVEYYIGESFSSRLLLVERHGEVWAIAADGLEDGTWVRSTFKAPQLVQPAPAVRTWMVDFRGGPPAWGFTASWEQRPNGRLDVVGRSGNAWLVIGDMDFEGSKARETDVAVEGVGLASIVSIGEGSSLGFDLVGFGLEMPPVDGRYRSASGGKEELVLTVKDGKVVAIGDAPGDAPGWQIDGRRLSFGLDQPTGKITWTGRIAPGGWIGTATEPGGRERVMDFVRLLDE